MEEEELRTASMAVILGIITLIFLYRKFILKGVMCSTTTRLNGKTVIVTGANSGIGKATAAELARRGARVILACRSVEKANKAAKDIILLTNNNDIVVKKLDLSSIKSIRNFVQDIEDSDEWVDILINNAGVSEQAYRLTEDGLEYTLCVNYLGPFLLTNLLLDRLVSSAPSRVINVSAHTHVFGRIHFDNLMLDACYTPWHAYCQSKLALIMFTRQLATLLQETDVRAYSVHPGITYTPMRHHNRWLMRLLLQYFCRSPLEGAQTIIYCATATELEEESGYYYSNCCLSTPVPDAFRDDLGQRLWKMSERLVGLAEPNIESGDEELKAMHGSDSDG